MGAGMGGLLGASDHVLSGLAQLAVANVIQYHILSQEKIIIYKCGPLVRINPFFLFTGYYNADQRRARHFTRANNLVHSKQW